MKKNQVATGIIYLKVKFEDTFPSNWEDDNIEEFIKKRIDKYIEDYEVDEIEILSTEIDNYGEDDLYEI